MAEDFIYKEINFLIRFFWNERTFCNFHKHEYQNQIAIWDLEPDTNLIIDYEKFPGAFMAFGSGPLMCPVM